MKEKESLLLKQFEEVKPQMSANALFHFMKKLDYLKIVLKQKGLAPRYCPEDISYMDLTVNDEFLEHVAYPEKCFCDIHLHQIANHIEEYGDYGIGLTKIWGIEKGIQPIQYINPYSNLMDDFRKAFQAAINIESDDTITETLSNYLLSHMVYVKPLAGPNKNRKTDEIHTKYLSDECEWRYVPNLDSLEMEPVLFNQDMHRKDESQKSFMDRYNDTLAALEETWLHFEYEDIRYLTVVSQKDRDDLISYIRSLEIEEDDRWMLVSKIVVVGDAKEDF